MISRLQPIALGLNFQHRRVFALRYRDRYTGSTMADRDQGRWRHHDPSRTEANRSSNAIAGPSSQVAGTKRIFSAPTGDSSGYRNVARKWPPPSESSSRLLVVKSARKTSQEWNPPVNRKSGSFDPMLHPVSRYPVLCIGLGDERLPIRFREDLRLWFLRLLDVIEWFPDV